jgi:hypothetical protein
MRPVDRDAIADRPTEQSVDRHAVGLAGDVEQGILDRRYRLLVKSTTRLARQDMQMQVTVELPWVLPMRAESSRSPTGRRSRSFVELRPADDAVVGGDLEGENMRQSASACSVSILTISAFLPDGNAEDFAR